MYEIPWFKTETTIFSNRKIQIILKLSEGDTYFRVWIQLIALAVECNNKGRLEVGENNPMTIQNFSKIMGKSNKKIEKILKKFLELGMLKKEGETFLIKNWDKYQSIEKYEKYQIQNRERQRKYREKHKSENEKRKRFRDIINKIYKQNYVEGKFQEENFENFNIILENEMAVKVAKDYTNKSIEKMQNEGLIITGELGLGKTYLAASIANKLIENDKIVLMGRLTMKK